MITELETAIRRFEQQKAVLAQLAESWRVTTAAAILIPLAIWDGMLGFCGLVLAHRLVRHARNEVMNSQRERLTLEARRIEYAYRRLPPSARGEAVE